MVGAGNLVDRKSTRLNSSHTIISYAVFCLKNKIGSYLIDRTIVPKEEMCVDRIRQCMERNPEEGRVLRLFFFLMIRRPPSSPLFPYPPLFRSSRPPRALLKGGAPRDPPLRLLACLVEV